MLGSAQGITLNIGWLAQQSSIRQILDSSKQFVLFYFDLYLSNTKKMQTEINSNTLKCIFAIHDVHLPYFFL